MAGPSPKVAEVLLPILYLRGLSVGDFRSALEGLLGEDAAGLRVMTYDTSLEMRKLLRLVVERGTGKLANAQGYLVGGKTGTAEKVSHHSYEKHANPRLAVLLRRRLPGQRSALSRPRQHRRAARQQAVRRLRHRRLDRRAGGQGDGRAHGLDRRNSAGR